MNVFVYSWGLGIWVSSTSFQKSNIGSLCQKGYHINIREQLGFWWSIPQNMSSIGHFGVSDDQTIRIRTLLEEIWLLRRRPVKLQRPPRSKGDQKFLRHGKSLLHKVFKVIQVLEFNNLRTNITLFEIRFILMFWKKRFLIESWKLMLNFSNFSVGGCYFFENRLMKLTWPNLRNTQIPSFWPKSWF